MYERNAIILERYFDKIFGYDMKSNIKTNFKDYSELVECLENYKKISEEEENIIQDYDLIANKIRDIQKRQEILNNKNTKYQEERTNIFQNIDENSSTIVKKINSTNTDIQNINEQIEENAQNYINVINEFNEKSSVRVECGKKRRIIEENYNDKLDETLDNYQNISIEQEKRAKQFVNIDTSEMEEELKQKIRKNGEKEKIPFNEEVIEKAIDLSIDIQKKETEILANIYEKTNRLFAEIKNGNTKVERHKKIIKDAQSKLEFIAALKEYLVQFLDNERLTAVNGVSEHNKLMQEACQNIEEDLEQINNLYTLLLKETSKRITKKSYNELYNLSYLKNLEKKSEEFEMEIKKVNLPVTIINPSYWRIEGMKRIYDTFNKCVTENYDRDLSVYFEEETKNQAEVEVKEKEEEIVTNNVEPKKKRGRKKKIVEEEIMPKAEEKEEPKEKTEEENKAKAKENKKLSIDKKIDQILGFGTSDDDEEDNDEWEDEDDWEDELEDIKKDDLSKTKIEEEDDDDDDDFEDDIFDEDYEDDYEEDNFDKEKEKNNDNQEDEEEDDDDDDSIMKSLNFFKKTKNNTEEDDEDFDDDDLDLNDEDFDDDDFDDDDFDDDEDEDDFEDEDESLDEDDEEYVEEKRKSTKKKNEKKQNNETKGNKKSGSNDEWENQFINIKEKNEKKKKGGFLSRFKK